jgi:hypothetical protein
MWVLNFYRYRAGCNICFGGHRYDARQARYRDRRQMMRPSCEKSSRGAPDKPTMEKGHLCSLFLPDILFCPGLGRSDFHAAIFVQSDDRDEIPKQWFCQKCQLVHSITILLPPAVSNDSSSLGHLESWPLNLLQYVINCLPLDNPPALALTSCILYEKLGSSAFAKPD